MIADSEIGVSITRSAPNFGNRPVVTPKMPPDASRWPDVPPAPPHRVRVCGHEATALYKSA
jgi:hypothetical protein